MTETIAVIRGEKDVRSVPSGATIFAQEDPGDVMYGVIEGAVEIRVGNEVVETVGEGGIFGEMSLFTGMPRTATCLVEEEAELLEIEAEDFARLLKRNPNVSEVIADLASKRNKENQELLAKIKELSAADIEDSTNKHSILARLKNLVIRLA